VGWSRPLFQHSLLAKPTPDMPHACSSLAPSRAPSISRILACQDLLPFLPELNVLDLLGQHDWRLKQFFRDPRLRAMFTFQVGAGSAAQWEDAAGSTGVLGRSIGLDGGGWRAVGGTLVGSVRQKLCLEVRKSGWWSALIVLQMVALKVRDCAPSDPPLSWLPGPSLLPAPPSCLQDLYVGLTPYTAPAVFGLLAGTELTDGVWYPLGGFQTVSPSLVWVQGRRGGNRVEPVGRAQQARA